MLGWNQILTDEETTVETKWPSEELKWVTFFFFLDPGKVVYHINTPLWALKPLVI